MTRAVSREFEGNTILLSNVGKIGDINLKVTPDTSAHDGRFDVSVISSRSLWDLLAVLFRMLTWRYRPTQRLHHFQSKRVVITTEPPVAVQIDGEDLGHTPLTAEVIPGGVHLVVGGRYRENPDGGGFLKEFHVPWTAPRPARRWLPKAPLGARRGAGAMEPQPRQLVDEPARPRPAGRLIRPWPIHQCRTSIRLPTRARAAISSSTSLRTQPRPRSSASPAACDATRNARVSAPAGVPRFAGSNRTAARSRCSSAKRTRPSVRWRTSWAAVRAVRVEAAPARQDFSSPRASARTAWSSVSLSAKWR